MNELAAERRKQPQDDLTSALLAAELEGESLTPPELASFFVLLVVAGNETTRNAISHGMKALMRLPRPAPEVGRRLRGRGARPRSRRSCAGRRR